jgi:hypothetical protein
MVTRVVMVPEAKLGIVILTNQEEGGAVNAIAYRVLDHYLGHPPSDWIAAYQESRKRTMARAAEAEKKQEAARARGTRASLEPARYAGRYRDPWYGGAAVALENGRLVLRMSRTPAMIADLEHWHHDTFKAVFRDKTIPDAFVTFALDHTGAVEQVRMQAASELADFSFDYHDLLFRPVPEAAQAAAARAIEIWHGDRQRVGHLGDAQDDFNLMGTVLPWREIDTLTWRQGKRAETPLSFRAFRRLVSDGDFNADIPIAALDPGPNEITVTARFRDGAVLTRTVTVVKETGSRPLPLHIRWRDVKDPQEVGQYVDGKWGLTESGLRTGQLGYDRLFLIGERGWQDYEVRTSVTLHEVTAETSPISGGNGVGVILRFAGHVTGGPRNFPSGQPKFGYQPFGAIGWLRWTRGAPLAPPDLQFYPGDTDRSTNLGAFPVRLNERYAVVFRCETLPDEPAGRGATRYSFKIWNASGPEPQPWMWSQVQRSATALRKGGVALVAHHADVTFGDIEITPLRPMPSP